MPKVSDLDDAIRAVCPNIDGVSVRRWDDRTSWRIDFAAGATDEQQRAASSMLQAFDPNAPVKAKADPRSKREKLQALFASAGLTLEDAQTLLR